MSEDTMREDATGVPAAGGAATGVPATGGAASPVEAAGEDEAAHDALLESLLVEEVSIDGMCGVY